MIVIVTSVIAIPWDLTQVGGPNQPLFSGIYCRIRLTTRFDSSISISLYIISSIFILLANSSQMQWPNAFTCEVFAAGQTSFGIEERNCRSITIESGSDNGCQFLRRNLEKLSRYETDCDRIWELLERTYQCTENAWSTNRLSKTISGHKTLKQTTTHKETPPSTD
jgi:hypothetical protein